MATADYVVEAATENVKYQIFKELDGICVDPVILATNTPPFRLVVSPVRPDDRKK